MPSNKKSKKKGKNNRQVAPSAVAVSPSVSSRDASDSSEMLTTAERWKDEGNAAFSQKNFVDALSAYQKAIEICASIKESLSGSNRQSLDSINDLHVKLLSNRAIVLIKVDRFEEAQEHCTTIIEGIKERDIPKVWYRRALARQGQASQILMQKDQNRETKSQQHAVVLLKLAQMDLNAALQAIARSSDDGREKQDMQRAIMTLAAQLKTSIEQNSSDESGKRKTGKAAPNSAATVIAPPPKDQREVVFRLLVCRRKSLAHHNDLAPNEGEAFFLIDWDWWCRWCRYVDFFSAIECLQDRSDVDEYDVAAATRSTKHAVLSYLPAGAVLPNEKESKLNMKYKRSYREEDDESFSSSSSEEEDEDRRGAVKDTKPPGIINNSDLFLLSPNRNGSGKSSVNSSTKDVYYHQWYRAYDGINDNVALKPHLVRGYHFEILPREVYSALRSWYGEVTPSLCRRSHIVNRGESRRVSTGLDENSLSNTQRTAVQLFPLQQSPDLSNEMRCGTCQAPAAKMRCKRCMAVRYCDRGCQESHWQYHKLECEPIEADEDSSSTAPEPQTLPLCDGRVGLNNLGNTCFMNSALQALSHAAPLTRHFLSNKFLQDVNQSNPLGSGGKLAQAYGGVMKDLWMRRSSGRGATSVSPTQLKRAIAMFAPRFAGYLQHDAQEFLAYLLDGLHEDLNRITKAPYVEMPDVNEGQKMNIAAARAWDAHRKRNDSLVMDTFYGQFKSTCVCPHCDRVSVSFDAFNHVSLEMPHQKNATVTASVTLFRCPSSNAGQSGRPVRYVVEIDRREPVSELKQALSSMAGIPSGRLAICEYLDNTITNLVPDDREVAHVRRPGALLTFELDPMTSDSIHVVLAHRVVEPNDSVDFSLRRRNSIGYPFMVSFPQSFTCRQTWDHIWNSVAHMVEPEHRESLRISVHNDQGGGAKKVFPASAADNSDADFTGLSHYIPHDLDEPLVSFLGDEAKENYVFMYLDWADKVDGSPEIDPQRFEAFDAHASYIEALNKEREKARNGAKGITLDECFEAFSKPERLDEQNMWYCSKCKEHVRAMKTMEIHRLPNILVVHLKRFEFRNTMRREKLDTLVNFPLDGLDMTVHSESPELDSLVDEEVPAVYDLFAVVNHFGRMGFGHYTAFARKWDETGISPCWSLFDDSSVYDVGDGKGNGPSESIVSPSAYVLFYRRRVFN